MVRKRGLGRLKLPPEFDHPMRNQLEEDLNRYHYACGCTTSAKLLLAGLAAGLIFSIYTGIEHEITLFNAILITVGTGIGGSILGKMIGLSKANKHLKETVRMIKRYWIVDRRDTTEEIPVLCG